MSFDIAIYQRARARLQAAADRRARARQARYEQAVRVVPELAEIDRELKRTVAAAVAAALTQGVDPAACISEQRARNLDLQARRTELLRGAGIDPDTLEDTPACLRCGDTGRADGTLCSCLRALCAEEQLRDLAEVLDPAQTFASFSLGWYGARRGEMESVLEICRQYALQFGTYPCKNLYLYGNPGLGKTFLSACIAREVASRGFSVVYDTAVNVFSRFEAQKFDRDDDARDETRRYLNCDLLILDDLGSEMATPFVQSALYTLINTRLTAARHTVISSNLGPDSLDGRYQPQIVSRLNGEFEGLPFYGRDIRRQRKEETEND